MNTGLYLTYTYSPHWFVCWIYSLMYLNVQRFVTGWEKKWRTRPGFEPWPPESLVYLALYLSWSDHYIPPPLNDLHHQRSPSPGPSPWQELTCQFKGLVTASNAIGLENLKQRRTSQGYEPCPPPLISSKVLSLVSGTGIRTNLTITDESFWISARTTPNLIRENIQKLVQMINCW